MVERLMAFCQDMIFSFLQFDKRKTYQQLTVSISTDGVNTLPIYFSTFQRINHVTAPAHLTSPNVFISFAGYLVSVKPKKGSGPRKKQIPYANQLPTGVASGTYSSHCFLCVYETRQ